MSRFITIAVFSYPAEAVVVKGKLESEQITVYLKDEYSVATDPFATNALGGVKMQVYREDYLKAMAILFRSNPELVKYRTEYIKCPNCGKNKVRETDDVAAAEGWKNKIRAGLYSIFPLGSRAGYICRHCHTSFDLDE
ncbi:MAG: hypothetical protein WBA16_02980 [Nonlabens sp.]